MFLNKVFKALLVKCSVCNFLGLIPRLTGKKLLVSHSVSALMLTSGLPDVGEDFKRSSESLSTIGVFALS